MWLKQSTAVEIKLGPFVDATDANTIEDALTISQADVRLAKNGGDWAQKNETTSLVHEENGWYRCLLDTTDTNTLGILRVAAHESGARPVSREFMVLPADSYNAIVSGNGNGIYANTVRISSNQNTALALNYALMNFASFDKAADAGNSTSQFKTSGLTSSVNDYYKHWLVNFVSGPAAGIPRPIATYDGITKIITFSEAFPVEPADGDTAVVLPVGGIVNIQTAQVQTAATAALNAYDPPTNTEMVAAFTQIKGVTWATTDTLEAIRDRGDTAWATATGFSTLDAAGVRTAVGLASANLDTQLGDLPTNAELATSQAAADDATLAAIAALNNVTAAQVATAVFTTAMTESYRSAGAAGTLSQYIHELIAHMGESSISGTIKTLKQLNGSTTAKTYTLDSAASPTSITETT